uniref:Uncharacterized protein n=1 Tax=Cacopsylla melanoneura TaxID=428564 RepID=A0A8D8UD79_9HEMI
MIYKSNNWGSAYWNNFRGYDPSQGLASHDSSHSAQSGLASHDSTHSAQCYKRHPARCSGTNRGYASEYHHHRDHTVGQQHVLPHYTQPGVPHQHQCANESLVNAFE